MYNQLLQLFDASLPAECTQHRLKHGEFTFVAVAEFTVTVQQVESTLNDTQYQLQVGILENGFTYSWTCVLRACSTRKFDFIRFMVHRSVHRAVIRVKYVRTEPHQIICVLGEVEEQITVGLPRRV